MRSRLQRPSPSLVISIVALFVAMGGTSYAAIAITGKNVKDSSLTGKDIKNSSLGGSDIKDKSLKASDFSGSVKGATGATGAKGATGATGATGPRGADGTDGVDGLDGSARAIGGVNSAGSANTSFGDGSDTAFTSSRASTGVYCISIPGISREDGRIIAMGDVSSGSPVSTVTRTSGFDCSGDEFEVQVLDSAGAPVNGGFVFMVP